MKTERTGFCFFLFGFVYAFKHCEKKTRYNSIFLVIFIAKF